MFLFSAELATYVISNRLLNGQRFKVTVV